MNFKMSFSKNLPNGAANPNYVDLLDEDKPIAQQKFVCVSFVSPENVLKAKSAYFFEAYVKTWEMSTSMRKYAQFTSFIAYKYNLDVAKLNEDLTDFCKEESAKLGEESVTDDFKNFLDKNETFLEEEFGKKNAFQTSVRGLKVRGVYPSQAEAELRAKLLREADPNFDVYVGPVGIWMPWEPDAYKTGRVEYLEEELNKLMAEKKSSEESAKDYFDSRVKATKMKAIEENKRKAAESGNKLSQTINKNGDLVGVRALNTGEDSLLENGEATEEDVRHQLFENENVVTKITDHGLSALQ
jgi:hypothetical protein